MTADDTYKWFYQLARPIRSTNALGPYRFFPADSKSGLILNLSEPSTKRILNLI